MLIFTVGQGALRCLAFSPAGEALAVGSNNRHLYLLHWPGGDVRWRLPSPSTRCLPRCVGFHPDGTRVSCIFTDGRTLEWEVATGQLRNQHEPHITPALGKPVAVWHAGPEFGWEWAYATRRGGAIAAVGCTYERELFPHSCRPQWVWPVEHEDLLMLSGRGLYHFQRQPDKVEPHPSLWRQVMTTLLRPLIGPTAPPLIERTKTQLKLGRYLPTAAALWPDAGSLLVGDRTGRVRRVSRASGHVLREWGLPLTMVHALAITPDGTVAAAGSTAGQLVIWDLDE